MKVGIDIRALDPTGPTGVGKYIVALLKQYQVAGRDLTCDLYYPWRRNSRKWINANVGNDYVTHMGWVPEMLSAERFNNLWLNWYLPTRIRKDHIDVFHGPSFFVPQGFNARRIVTIHDMSHALFPELYEGISSDAIIARTMLAVREADAVVADSEYTRQDVIKIYGVNPGKVRTIHLGIDSRYTIPPDPEHVREVSKRYNLPECFIYHVGSYHPRKNTEAILKALKVLKDRGRPMHLVLSGKKTRYFNHVKKLVCDLHLEDSVKYLGYLSDDEIHALYSTAMAMVYPSLYEGFCLPVMEAMASGLPCIISNRACLPEIAGGAAIVVDPDEPENIADAIVSVWENREMRQHLVRKGVKRAAQFSWRDTARKTLDLYQEVAGA